MPSEVKKAANGIESLLTSLIADLLWLKYDDLISIYNDENTGEMLDHAPAVKSRIKKQRRELVRSFDEKKTGIKELKRLRWKVYPEATKIAAERCERRVGAFPQKIPVKVRHLLKDRLPAKGRLSTKFYQPFSVDEIKSDFAISGFMNTPLREKCSGLSWFTWALMKPVSKECPTFLVWEKYPESGKLCRIDSHDVSAELSKFFEENREAIYKHWNMEWSSREFIEALTKVAL